jgi:hypothetical protein
MKNKSSQFDMNITLANLESFQEAIKQASKVIKSFDPSERLDLADRMRKGVTCDFFELQFDDNEDQDDDDADAIATADDEDEDDEDHTGRRHSHRPTNNRKAQMCRNVSKDRRVRI